MVLLAGTRMSPSSRRTSSSRILRAPQCGFSLLRPDDQALDLLRQLVGVAHRPPGAVAQRLEPVLLVAIEDLVAGLAGDAELPAHLASWPRPSSSRATKRRRSSITEHAFHGINTSRRKERKVLPMCPVRTVTYVSGRTKHAIAAECHRFHARSDTVDSVVSSAHSSYPRSSRANHRRPPGSLDLSTMLAIAPRGPQLVRRPAQSRQTFRSRTPLPVPYRGLPLFFDLENGDRPREPTARLEWNLHLAIEVVIPTHRTFAGTVSIDDGLHGNPLLADFVSLACH